MARCRLRSRRRIRRGRSRSTSRRRRVLAARAGWTGARAQLPFGPRPRREAAPVPRSLDRILRIPRPWPPPTPTRERPWSAGQPSVAKETAWGSHHIRPGPWLAPSDQRSPGPSSFTYIVAADVNGDGPSTTTSATTQRALSSSRLPGGPRQTTRAAAARAPHTARSPVARAASAAAGAVPGARAVRIAGLSRREVRRQGLGGRRLPGRGPRAWGRTGTGLRTGQAVGLCT